MFNLLYVEPQAICNARCSSSSLSNLVSQDLSVDQKSRDKHPFQL